MPYVFFLIDATLAVLTDAMFVAILPRLVLSQLMSLILLSLSHFGIEGLYSLVVPGALAIPCDLALRDCIPLLYSLAKMLAAKLSYNAFVLCFLYSECLHIYIRIVEVVL